MVTNKSPGTLAVGGKVKISVYVALLFVTSNSTTTFGDLFVSVVTNLLVAPGKTQSPAPVCTGKVIILLIEGL